MSGPSATASPVRPYFFPDGFDLAAQSEAFRAAYAALIEPAYHQLVVAPLDALERAAGMTIAFLLMEELLDQFELGEQFNLGPSGTEQQSREQKLHRYLRLVSAKQTAISALLRIRKLPRHSPVDLLRQPTA